MSRAFALHVCGASTGLVTRRASPALTSAARRGAAFPSRPIAPRLRGSSTSRVFAFGAARARRGSGTMASASADPPAFTFGLLADIQYVDVDDKPNFTGTQWRRYRNALVVAGDGEVLQPAPELDSCCTTATSSTTSARLTSRRTRSPKHEAMSALGEVMSVLSEARCENWHFTVGNHELYNFTRDELRDGVSAPGATLPFRCADANGDFFYAFKPSAGWRVLVLDAYDVSIYRNGRERGLDAEALATLCANNANCDKYVSENPDILETERMSGTFPYFKDLEGLDSRWVPFNGGVGEAQLSWVKEQLEEATAADERVVLFSHLLVHPESTAKRSGRTLLWNFQDLLDVLEHPGVSDRVAAVISGHQHDGGVYTSPSGTHYVVMESPIVAEKGYPGPYAVVEARGESLTFVGFGKGKDSNLFPGGAEGGENVSPLTRELPLRPLGGKAGAGA